MKFLLPGEMPLMYANTIARLNGCSVTVNPEAGVYELEPYPIPRSSVHPHGAVVVDQMFHVTQAV